jgi:hypothetical protein
MKVMMGLTVAIAAVHAIPPIAGAAVFRTKKALLIGGVTGVALAIAVGSPAFVIPDLLGVACGVGLGAFFLPRHGRD